MLKRNELRDMLDSAEKVGDRFLRSIGLDPMTEENEGRVMVDAKTARLYIKVEDLEKLLKMVQSK